MYIAKITFKKPQGSDFDNEEINSLISIFLISLNRNGNILKPSLPLKDKGNSISFHAYIPEKDSLNRKFRPHLSEHNRLKEKSISVGYKILKKSPLPSFYPGKQVEENVKDAEFLLLHADLLDETSPIKTSNALKYVPQYKIANHKDEFFYETIYFWQKKYKSIDTLWIHGHKEMEKFALKQLSDPKSELSEEGMEICRKVEEILNKKVFYSLFVPYYKRESKNREIDLCPSCKSYWKLKEDLLRYFGYKCDNCSLIGVYNYVF